MTQVIDDEGMRWLARHYAFHDAPTEVEYATAHAILDAPEQSCDYVVRSRVTIMPEVRQAIETKVQNALCSERELGRYGWEPRKLDNNSRALVHQAVGFAMDSYVWMLAERRVVHELSNPLKRELLTEIDAYVAWPVISDKLTKLCEQVIKQLPATEMVPTDPYRYAVIFGPKVMFEIGYSVAYLDLAIAVLERMSGHAPASDDLTIEGSFIEE